MVLSKKLIEFKNVSFKYRQRQGLMRYEDFWALKEISFEVYEGETLGIVGVNGCGKSTLLKLISGIYSHDSGDIVNHGVTVSLLTLSAGFDDNLNGYDNIYISGMLLGLSKRDIEDKIDEIIAYSELSDFIYKPIKTYSSGMRARLGFSIATTLQPDVLLVDEVLGVGDEKFRRKAEATMMEKMNGSQTTIMVSHSGHQVRRVCDRVIWIHKGKIVQHGSADFVMNEYQHFLSSR